MSIAAGSVKKDGTLLTPSDGTATAMNTLGNTRREHPVYFDGTDFLVRSDALFSVKTPKVSSVAPNGYTQARAILQIKVPLALDNGLSTVNSFNVEFSYDVETTAAEKATIRGLAAQIIYESAFDAFWDQLSMA